MGTVQGDGSSRVTVDVLIPVRNGGALLPRMIESLSNQTHGAWRAIVVDDGSTDSTPRILDAAARTDRRFTIVTNPTTLGVARSLNRALRESTAPFIARLDADDACMPDRFARQVEVLESNPEIDILGSAAALENDRGGRIGTAVRPEHHDAIVRKLYRETPVFHPSVMVRRDVYVRLDGYDPTLRFAQDADLWLRAAREGFRFHNLQEPLVTYRVRPEPGLLRAMWGSWALLRRGFLDRDARGVWGAARHFASAAAGRRLDG